MLQFSLWNFVRYNVFGGGDSALYGVESSSFYMRNGLNNLNLILPLGLVYPLVAMLDLFQVTGGYASCFYNILINYYYIIINIIILSLYYYQ